MGDIKRLKKKYFTARHPWVKSEIEESKVLKKEYGLAKKKEILLANTFLKKYKDITKRLIADFTPQGVKEKTQMTHKLEKLGLLPAGAKLDQVLSLTLRNILDRRMQTIIFRKGQARSIKQARQFITHRHVVVAEKPITSPGYLVSLEEEGKISFKGTSSLASTDHPERTPLPPKPVKVMKVKPKHYDSKTIR